MEANLTFAHNLYIIGLMSALIKGGYALFSIQHLIR